MSRPYISYSVDLCSSEQAYFVPTLSQNESDTVLLLCVKTSLSYKLHPMFLCSSSIHTYPHMHKYIPGCSFLPFDTLPLSFRRPNISSPSPFKAVRGPLRFKRLFQSLLAIKSSVGRKGPASPLSVVEVRCPVLLYELSPASESPREVPHLTTASTDR